MVLSPLKGGIMIKIEQGKKYLVTGGSGFLGGWKTKDVDIILTGKLNYKELQKLLIDGISLGVNYVK